MPFVKNNSIFVFENNRIKLSEQYMKDNSWKFKRLTATKFSSVIGLDEFSSPFKMWCIITGIYKDREPDPIVTRVGTVIEPKVREYFNKCYGIKYTFYEPKEVGYDIFKKIDPIVGGIPDCEPSLDGHTPDYSLNAPMVEVKTASVDKFLYKPDEFEDFILQKDENGEPIVKMRGAGKLKWFDDNGKFSPSKSYLCQLGLYLYLRKQTKGVLACVFVDTKDYTHPENVVVSKDNMLTTQLTIDLDKFGKVVEQAKKWYRDYVKTGVSPVATDKDIEWLKLHKII